MKLLKCKSNNKRARFDVFIAMLVAWNLNCNILFLSFFSYSHIFNIFTISLWSHHHRCLLNISEVLRTGNVRSCGNIHPSVPPIPDTKTNFANSNRCRGNTLGWAMDFGLFSSWATRQKKYFAPKHRIFLKILLQPIANNSSMKEPNLLIKLKCMSLIGNIARGETLQAITPFPFSNFYHKLTFIIRWYLPLGKGEKKEKKLTSVSFMYVCVAGNGEMLVFFSFFPPTIVK